MRWEDAQRAADAEVERLQEEALTLGVRRVYRREIQRAFLRGRLWGQRDMMRRLREEHLEDADADTPDPLEPTR